MPETEKIINNELQHTILSRKNMKNIIKDHNDLATASFTLICSIGALGFILMALAMR